MTGSTDGGRFIQLQDGRSLNRPIISKSLRRGQMKMSRRNYLQLRFSDSELAAYQALADKVNVPLATWARDTLNNAVQLDDVRVEFDRLYAKAEEKGREFARKLLSRNASKMYI